MPLIFVYGTLKRGCSNHDQMRGQTFLAETHTAAGFRLYSLGDYPGMVRDAGDQTGVTGEIWEIDSAALARLDAFEGVPEGLYRREAIALPAPAFAREKIETYLFAGSILGRTALGPVWRES